MISDLPRRRRYDVGLINKNPHDLTVAEVWWSMDVDLEKVLIAVTGILALKEKAPDAYEGNIVIRTSRPIVTPQYHGRLCEADGDDGRRDSDRHLQSVGGDPTSSTDGTSYGYTRVQQALQASRLPNVNDYIADATMSQRDCCACTAKEHSALDPMRCTRCSKCTGWRRG